MAYVRWLPVLERSAEIVREYEGGVTLRQLFYRLVSEGEIPNTKDYYKSLSRYTAQARRGDLSEEGLDGGARDYIEKHGAFPNLVDTTRAIRRPSHWSGPREAMQALQRQYRVDRLSEFDKSIFVAVEKTTVENVVAPWFRERGIPVVALRGYSSQTFVDHVVGQIESENRPAVVVYAGDLDPTGIDIERDLQDRAGNIASLERVAVTPGQVEELDLSKNPAPEDDSRNDAFRERFGELFQVEVEALPVDTLRELLEDAVAEYWEPDAYQARVEEEEGHLETLSTLAAQL